MAGDEYSFEELSGLGAPQQSNGGKEYSFEELSSPKAQPQSGVKENIASFATGVGKVVPFGQDIPAALNVARSYLGGHPYGVPTDGGVGERFDAAKRAQMEAAKILGEKAPLSQYAGMATGIAGSLAPIGRAAQVEEAIAQGAKNIVPQALSKIFPRAAPAIASGASKAGTGAALGSLYGLGEGETTQERIDNALRTAAFGAASPAIPVIASAGSRAAGAVTSLPLWLKTGESMKSLNDAVKAGADKSAEFWHHLSGNKTGEDLVNRVQKAVGDVADQRSRDYTARMASIGANKNILDYSGVDSEVNNAFRKSMTPTGVVYNPEAHAAVSEAKNIVDSWKAQPSAPVGSWQPHSIEDFDKLKRALDSVHYKYSREFGAETPAARAVSDIRRSVFDTIKNEDPAYADMMEQYADTTKFLNEVRKEVTGSKTASVGSKIRKILSKRDDAHKGKLIEDLASVDSEIPNAIAGHELSALMPQGIRGTIVNAITASGGFLDPYVMLSLASSSPKVAGALQYGIGRSGALPADIEKLIPGATRGVAFPAIRKDRESRATGGRIQSAKTADMLIKAFDNARKRIQSTTEALLDQPDESVVHALKVAKQHI